MNEKWNVIHHGGENRFTLLETERDGPRPSVWPQPILLLSDVFLDITQTNVCEKNQGQGFFFFFFLNDMLSHLSHVSGGGQTWMS